VGSAFVRVYNRTPSSWGWLVAYVGGAVRR
jgi:hypothetical protein